MNNQLSMPIPMTSNRKAWCLLAVISVCVLVADRLPEWHKLWFVAESGQYHTSSGITVLLLAGMFLRWRPALGLMVVWQLLHCVFIYLALFHGFPTGDHTPGYSVLAFLRLTALGIIFLSAEVNRYVRYKSTNHASAV